ncbi:MAG: hypothetical protein WCS52_03960 [bacterium]
MKIFSNNMMKGMGSLRDQSGMALGMVMVVVLAVSVLGVALMSSSTMNALETSRYLNSVKAFWLAEAGIQRFDKRAFAGVWSPFTDTSLGGGGIQVAIVSNAVPPYAESVGTVQGDAQRIRVEFQYLALSYQHAIFAANKSGVPWTFTLRGTGNPATVSGHERSGRDVVMGNIYADGDVVLYEQSMISNAPAPNAYHLMGDVEATGRIALSNAASIRGSQYENVMEIPAPDLVVMNYASNNNWNIRREFQNARVTSGNLPVGHPLRNVVVINPSDRSAENSSTPGDDFYFEPMNANNNGATQKEAKTPLALGANQTYYVDGNVWFHNLNVYGFAIDGTATIASTRDIHISDNLKYASTNSLLGLVSLGSYDSAGHLQSGGNVYFGDPEYGTTYTVDAFMFAANDFYYNTSANTPTRQEEPTTGFQVFGNYAAMNQVLVFRDWYTGSSGDRSAWYDPRTNRWLDSLTGTMLSSSQTNTLRHYQMTVKYDERIRNQSTQPPRLPRQQSGVGSLYGGITQWSINP